MTACWIWLAARPGLGPVKLRELLERFGSPRELFAADEAALERMGLNERTRRALADKDLRRAHAILQDCNIRQITVLTLGDEAYPSALRQTADAPLVLYCRGRLPAGPGPRIGVVGARQADERGLTAARRISREIAGCGGVVVTGMAKGVDAEAARGALEAGGAVVGVLGGGVDVVYPAENAALFARVEEQGCLLSEYPPGTTPNARHFPARNRIISALSDGVVVVQAAEHSGALITARWAADQGRDVFSVPGPAGDALCRGSNQLLRDGAILAECGWDVMREYLYRYPGAVREYHCEQVPVLPAPPAEQPAGRQAAPKVKAPAAPDKPAERPAPKPLPAELTPLQRRVLDALEAGPLQLDALIGRLDLPAAQVLPQLTLLQIKGLITQKPGKIYER